jgi:hypothetical protein
MAASAGQLKILLKDGSTYVVDAYQPDAVSTYIGFNASGLAGTASSTTLTVPKDAVAIVGWSVVTGATAVGMNIILNSGSKAGYTVRHALHLNTLATRQAIFFPVSPGDQLQALQF